MKMTQLRLTVLSMMIIVALGVGCSKMESQAVEKVKAVKKTSTPQAPVTEDDCKILDVVLLDLMNYKAFETWNRGDDASKKIILDSMTVGLFDRADHHQFDIEAKDSLVQGELVELGDDLERRNPKKLISLAGYITPSPKIFVKNLSTPSQGEINPVEGAIDYRFRLAGLPAGSHFVIAWLPGYTKDGNTAVFRAYTGPSPHGASLTYKLAKKDKKWTVVWRCYNFYK